MESARPESVLRLAAEDGTTLHVADWSCPRPGAQRRGVLILHGLGEHSGRYAHVAQFFNECGFDVRIYDHRGHGRSGGARGDVPDEEALLRDAAVVLKDFARQFDVPPLLLGHSMGGLFAARFAAARLEPIGALILSSPALALPLSTGQKLLLRILNATAPGFAIPNGLQTRYLSHDTAVIEAYCKDLLVHSKISARLLRSMLSAVDYAQTHANRIAVPTLLVVAGDDRLVDSRGSDAFFSKLESGVGTIQRFPELYHELFNELDAAPIFECVRTWLVAQGLMPRPIATQSA